mmetsp:Transcript_80793/g.228668  ORF Transcript_80793/g.228668 Transcript_80793/m.228668 type:complete len:204 (+) Transcript_80793:312-923(+)
MVRATEAARDVRCPLPLPYILSDQHPDCHAVSDPCGWEAWLQGAHGIRCPVPDALPRAGEHWLHRGGRGSGSTRSSEAGGATEISEGRQALLQQLRCNGGEGAAHHLQRLLRGPLPDGRQADQRPAGAGGHDVPGAAQAEHPGINDHQLRLRQPLGLPRSRAEARDRVRVEAALPRRDGGHALQRQGLQDQSRALRQIAEGHV